MNDAATGQRERDGFASVPATMDNVPRNQWYVAAGSEEVDRSLLARRLLDKSIVLYRTENGDPVVLDDRCPHRLMPFALGRLIGDEIQCGYHGFRFGPSGQCTAIPSMASVPRAMRVRRYPLVEREGWIWIWMGDEALADAGLLPRPGYGKPGYRRAFHFCYPMHGNYLRLHENLMDTSHPSFLHEGLFDDGELAAAPYRVEVEGSVVRLIRETREHVPNESTAFTFNLEPGARVKRTLITETHAPCLNVIYNSFAYVDDPARPPSELINFHPVVPAGPRDCYQFSSSLSSYEIPDKPAFEDFLRAVFAQDSMALDAIENSIAADGPDAVEISVRPDEASLRLRRIILDMANAERAGGRQ